MGALKGKGKAFECVMGIIKGCKGHNGVKSNKLANNYNFYIINMRGGGKVSVCVMGTSCLG